MRRLLFFGVLAIVNGVPSGALALDVDVRTTGIMSLRGERDRNVPSISPASTITDTTYAYLYLYPKVSLDIGEHTTLVVGLFSGEVSRQTLTRDATKTFGVEYIGDYATDTFFIREAYIDLFPADWAEVSAGKQRVVAGSPFILDNYQPSVTMTFLFGDSPVSVSSSLVKVEPFKFYDPERKSLLGEVEISYSFGPFQSDEVAVFLAVLGDNDNFLAGLLNTMTSTQVDILERRLQNPLFRRDFLNAIADRFERTYGHRPSELEMERIIGNLLSASIVRSSNGTVFWPGLRGRTFLGDLTLSGDCIFEIGALGLRIHDPVRIYEPENATTPVNLLTSSFLFDITGNYQVTKKLSIGGFFLFQRGEADNILKILDDKSFSSFLAVSPFITYTNIFFNGGVNENVSSGSLSTAGRNGFGVVSPGLTLGYSFTDSLDLNVTLAIIRAESPRVAIGREADLDLLYGLNETFDIIFEADILSPAESSQEPIWKTVVGVDAVW